MKLKTRIWLLLSLLAGLVVAIDLSVSYRNLAAELWAETENEARTVYGFMMATRRIYQQQFVDSGLPVNSRTVGFLPAHSFSRIAKDYANWNRNGIIFNNVSDRPRNPGNQADRHELAAMDWFRANPTAIERTVEIAGENERGGYLLYTAPIWIEPFCLKCHGDPDDAPAGIRGDPSVAYGYQVGDLRGLVSIKIPKAKYEHRLRELWSGRLARSLAGYAVLLLVVGLLLDRLVMRRLGRLQAGAERIAAGDYSTRVEAPGQDELCSLARTFNRMAEEVETREQALRKLTHFDVLTGLPNRTRLLDHLNLALAVARRHGRLGALVLFNIDRFKTLNDARGHEFGDSLLVALGGRLAGLMREGDTLARLAADEFAILLPDLESQREAAGRRALAMVERVGAALRLPFMAEGEEVTVAVSLGITLCPESEDDTPQQVMRRADTALHRAKDAGGGQAAFFETDMGQSVERRFRVERELRRAISAGELRLYLQSQVDAANCVIGAEALVRWQHPEQGLLLPGGFIPVAEETGLIVDLGAWVLAEACHLLAREGQQGRSLRLSVNLSPRQFRQPNFVPWLKDLLTASGADPGHLTLEVTEGLVIGDIADAVGKMTELAALGVHFSVDDFGTGYSSLAYLKRLPIHELKIDKTFVQDAPTDPNDAALVETILSIARHLHLKVVAEGVETEEQAAFLNARATVIHQGYLYGRPEPVETWLGRWRAEA